MRKAFTAIVWGVLWLSPSSVHAQTEVEIALKGGLNAATQAKDFRVNRYGFSGGLSADLQWPLVGRLSLGAQTELLYTPRGAEVIFEGEHVGKLRLHYFDLTITARPEAHFGAASIYLLLGGGLNLLASATRDDAAGAGQDVTDGFHRIDISLLGAAGVALHFPHRERGLLHFGTAFLELRHDVGLLDVDITGGFKNRTSSFMLGLSFVMGDGTTVAQPQQSIATTVGLVK